MKYLGIDYGTKRIGLATSSEDGVFAFPYGTLEEVKDPISKIKEIVEKESINEIVIGLSLDMSGKENPINEKIKMFGEEVASETGLRVQYERETMTSLEAVRDPNQKSIRNARQIKKEKVENIDARAAQIILARFLEKLKNNFMEEVNFKESMSTEKGFQKIEVQKQYEDLFLLDKQIADESEGLLFPLESPQKLKNFLIEEHKSENIVLNNEDGKHVGYLSYYDIDSNTSELLNIGVLKEFQGKGYAQEMMEKYFELNPNKEKFVLVTRPDNIKAIRFYEKLGYKIVELKKDYYGPGEDRVFLEKRR